MLHCSNVLSRPVPCSVCIAESDLIALFPKAARSTIALVSNTPES